MDNVLKLVTPIEDALVQELLADARISAGAVKGPLKGCFLMTWGQDLDSCVAFVNERDGLVAEMIPAWVHARALEAVAHGPEEPEVDHDHSA